MTTHTERTEVELLDLTNRELASRIISRNEPYLTDSTLYAWERDNLAKQSKKKLVAMVMKG